MSPVTGATATHPPAKPTRRKRGEGQWALGYREPLNKNEELKKSDDGPPDYVERVLRRYDAACTPGESLAAWTLRASDEELS